MTRESESRGILYTAPPSEDDVETTDPLAAEAGVETNGDSSAPRPADD